MTHKTINNLLSQWNRRLANGTQSAEYKCALSECIYDLQSAETGSLASSYDEIQDYFAGLEADRLSHTV